MTVDPITFEIVRGAVNSIILQMEGLIERTAMSPVIKEKMDYFVGIYDVSGRIVDAFLSTSGPRIVDPVLKAYPMEDMRPGDLYWYNDPHGSQGAIQHTGDMCFLSPVFHDGAIVAFAVSFGHFWDIGGSVAGSLSPHASEIFHEGMLVPPIRIMRAGELNREAYAVILNNSRFPDMLEGDTRALMAACRLAEDRLDELMGRYGQETVLGAFDEIIDRSVAAYREFVREVVPQGEHAFFDYVDADPVTGEPRRIDVKFIHNGDELVADLTDSGPQATGPVNFITSPGAFNLLLARHLAYMNPELPLNEGAVSFLDDVRTKPGTITNPNYPAPVGLRSHTVIRLMGCMGGLLAGANGGRAPAASPVYVIYNLRGFDEDGAYLYFSEGIGSGMGARPTADGLNAIYFRDQRNYPIEFEEGEFPLRVERYAIRPDSGGPGYHRGGCGVVKDVRIMVDCTMSTRMDNVRFPCFGINGGGAGWPGRFTLNPRTDDELDLPPAGENIAVKAGDLLRVETGGGGGWGDPFTKPPEDVFRGVQEGFVSIEAALAQYGVALTPDGLDVDATATDAARSAERAARPSVDRGENGREWLARLGVAK
ncbi:MAG: hydantoinase B/oxoprolinase family protein [SAR202 cluster bacterium]|jgi:N-methylhydantoinase B|nr:hydantoinase B/oxoprolinase family protein [SAR202 cluster bacterium]HJO82372.1 hydantoinase B/oxoprolinase family protein [SAR202 cluster bacterium]